MYLVDIQLDDPLENLVCDELLLNHCDEGEGTPLIRFWESTETCVVLGYGNRMESEVYVDQCRAEAVPVYRRCTGGGTVLLGPGSLSYSLVLPLSFHSSLNSVCGVNEFIMERQRATLERLLKGPVRICGCTDLVQGSLKFSGNAQRRRRSALLFHGTFLLDYDLSAMDRLLRSPSRQPAYREQRGHSAFTKNIGLDPQSLREGLCDTWEVSRTWEGVFRWNDVAEESRVRRGNEKWLCLSR